MAYTVFYSWQTDTRANANRTLVGDALTAAVTALGEGQVDDSPRVDSGMEGIAGSPEVATVMFDKIRRAAVFVGDVTLVGTVQRADGQTKRVPNANVSVEMGYAAGILGWERVIAVMNNHYGTPFEQPFDVRNRRFPITYTLDPEDTASRPSVLSQLVAELEGAIRAVGQANLATAEAAMATLDTACRTFIVLYGNMPLIAEPDPRVVTIGAATGLDTARFNAAAARLLDLGLIRAVTDQTSGAFAYEWTYLGKMVLAGVR